MLVEIWLRPFNYGLVALSVNSMGSLGDQDSERFIHLFLCWSQGAQDMLCCCPAVETSVIFIQCNHVVAVTQTTVDFQHSVTRSYCLICSGFRSQPALHWNCLLLMFMEKNNPKSDEDTLFTDYQFLTVSRYWIVFLKSVLSTKWFDKHWRS